jgi:hypothetical protein
MTTLTDAQMREALDAFRTYGTKAEAARQIGMTRETYKHRLSAAQAWEKAQRAPDYTAPTIESADEDLESVIGRLEAEQERRQKARASAEWAEFKVRGDDPFALVFIGDPHVDTCDIGLLRRHVETIERSPRMWAVGLGDWTNAWVGKLRGQYAFQSTTERDAYRLARWLLQKPVWWAIILGNHNGGRWHGDGSPLKWMETASPTPVQEWQVKFKVSSGDHSWKIWAAHNFPGNSIYNPNHGPDKRALFTGAMADLFIAGDRHTFKLSQDQHEHTGRIFWSARAKGYKYLDLYAEELGYSGGQSIGHSIGAVFDPRSGNLTCFSDVEEAARYLEFLLATKRAA